MPSWDPLGGLPTLKFPCVEVRMLIGQILLVTHSGFCIVFRQFSLRWFFFFR